MRRGREGRPGDCFAVTACLALPPCIRTAVAVERLLNAAAAGARQWVPIMLCFTCCAWGMGCQGSGARTCSCTA